MAAKLQGVHESTKTISNTEMVIESMAGEKVNRNILILSRQGNR
jgi:hypothetical protein